MENRLFSFISKNVYEYSYSKNVYEYSYVVDVCMLICCYPICYKYLL